MAEEVPKRVETAKENKERGDGWEKIEKSPSGAGYKIISEKSAREVEIEVLPGSDEREIAWKALDIAKEEGKPVVFEGNFGQIRVEPGTTVRDLRKMLENYGK